jgi:broad specificity phosphatase PhoE
LLETILTWDEISNKLSQPLYLNRNVELHLIRHAESTMNANNIITGSLNPELSPAGVAQAKTLGSILDIHYDIAFCSRLKRTKDTLDLALNSCRTSVKDFFYDARLNERNLGILQGQPNRYIPEFATGNLDYIPYLGESYKQVSIRLLSFLIDLLYLITEETEVNKILICSHSGIMRILFGIIEEFNDPSKVLNLSFPNTQLLRVNLNRLTIPPFLIY